MDKDKEHERERDPGDEQIRQQIDEMRQAEHRFRQLLEAAPDPIIIVDEAGAIELVNQQTEAVFSYQRASLLGQPVERLIPAMKRERHREHRAAFMERPEIREMGATLELEAVASTGRSFPVEVRLSPLETEEGIRIIAVVRDISARKETEQSMRQNEALYRLIARYIPNGFVLVVDEEMRYRLADGPALREQGYGDLEGLTPWDVLPSELADRRVTAYRAALAGKSISSQMTLDGRTYRQQTVPLPGEDGIIRAALVLTHDVTDLIAAEETARRLLQLSSALHGTLDIGVLLNTLTREAIRLTGATGGFSGLNTPEGLITRHYFHEGERLSLNKSWAPGEGIPGGLLISKEPYMTNDTLADEKVSVFAERFRVRSLICTPVLDREGELIAFFEVTNKEADAPFTEEDRERLVAVSQIAAISIENAQAYARIREFSREIVSAQEAERRRISRDLHDSVGQLLTALKLNLSLLLETQEDRGLRAQLQELEDLAEQAHDEIRATSHALRPPALEMVGLDKTLRALCEEFAAQAALEITYEGEQLPTLPDQVAISFYRFLQETLANVGRHAQATAVKVQLAQENGQILLSVEDNGVGMALPQQLYAGPGAGMGILGLQERFELIGGKVRLQAAPGQGTHIMARYSLPAEEVEEV